jgi:hypothetical protein
MMGCKGLWRNNYSGVLLGKKVFAINITVRLHSSPVKLELSAFGIEVYRHSVMIRIVNRMRR